MKAIILVGGYGTRMRPLTFHCPKPIFPFVNKSPVQFQIEALSKVGVKEIILGINCQSHHKSQEGSFKHEQQEGSIVPINSQAQQIINELKGLQQKYNVKLIYSQKQEALGTAGPLKFAQKQLRNQNKEGLFFVFNSDVIANYPLQELLDFHKQHKRQATIVLAQVKQPSRFGVVITASNGKVERFIEKPKQFVGNKINAGIYCLNLSILDRIPERFCMIETQIYPKLVEEEQLYSLPIKDNFWFDIGKPGDYLIAQGAYLDYYKINSLKNSNGNVLVHQTSVVEEQCKIGPNVVIGPNCLIKKGVRLSNASLIGSVVVGNYSYINNSIISWNCTVGRNVRIEGLTAIAEDCEIKDQVRITACMVCSHKVISCNSQNQILM